MCGRSAFEACGTRNMILREICPLTIGEHREKPFSWRQMSKDAAELFCLSADKWPRMKH